MIIIGGSAAATAAGIYASRRNLNFKIISKDFGGEVATSGEVDNYPGVPDSNGIELADKFKKHLSDYGVEPELGVEVEKIEKIEDGTFCLTAKKDGPSSAGDKVPALRSSEGAKKCDYVAKAVIITTGVHPRELNVPGEKELRNKGVSYCTVCDGPLFKDKTVAIIGGGNSALEAGIMMAGIASKVYMVNKNPAFKGEQVLMDNLMKSNNVEVVYNAVTSEIFGDGLVSGLKYKDQSGERELKVEGIFIHIGMVPNSGLVPEGVEKNGFGEIVVSKNCETGVPGLFAAGDVTDVPFKQIVISAGQGTCALLQAVNYLNRLKST